MTDIKRLTDLAAPVAVAIQTQLSLASREARDALKDNWALGYCLGMFDATAQRSKLDQYTEGIALITIGFATILDDPAAGAQRLKTALDSQEDPEFASGAQTGGNDLFSWASESTLAPMSLFQHLIDADDAKH